VPEAVGREALRAGIRELGLAEQTVCVHSSLRSFGSVEGGPDAVVDAFLAEGCTLVVPTFSGTIFGLAPVEGMRAERNGKDYDLEHPSPGAGRVFTPESNEVGSSMGAIPVAVLARPGRVRGANPLSSFTAVGPRADPVAEQRPLDVYAPLRILAARDGYVLLIGVGLDRMTLLHAAEERAGRALFRRWANGPDGRPMEVEIGGDSAGFPKLEPVLAPLARETRVGESRWRAFPARATLAAAADAIRADPAITHCDADCLLCDDAVAGGARSARF
jgi:aminoglycoside 3-N-acetyltransferase